MDSALTEVALAVLGITSALKVKSVAFAVSSRVELSHTVPVLVPLFCSSRHELECGIY